MTSTRHRFLRFCLVGGVCAALNLLVFYVLIGRLEWPTYSATTVAFVVVNAFGYWANRQFTFERQGSPVWPQAARYYLVMLASFVANVGAMQLLVDVAHIHYLIASLLLSGAFAILNFVLQRHFTFDSLDTRNRRGVLLVTHYYPGHGGGVEIVAGELAQRLARRIGNPIEWWASDTDLGIVAAGVQCRSVASWNGLERRLGLPIPVWSPIALARLAIRSRQVSLVHVHDLLYPGNLVAAIAAIHAGTPLIVTQHLSIVPYRNHFLRTLMDIATRLIVVPLLRRATGVVFIADSARDYFDDRCQWSQPPHFIPNGVDTALFRRPTESEREQARRELGGFDGRQRMALFVGRFVEKKGLVLLREIAAACPETQFIFAGAGPLNPGEWQLPNVRVASGRSGISLRCLYWAADALVLPSVGEGFPLVVQEALATGLAAVVSPDVAAGCTAIKACLEVEALGDQATQRWACRIRETCSEESVARRDALATAAASVWSWDVASDRYSDLYRQVAPSLGP